MLVNIHEAKTHLSRLVQRAAEGEEIIIGRAGKPVAKLVPYEPRKEARQLGLMKGMITFLPGYDEADEEIERLFEESINEPPP